MSNIRQSQTKLASEYLILIRTFLSQPYIHPGMQFFVHSLSKHHVVMIESGGNIMFFTGTPNIPPTFLSQLHDVQIHHKQKIYTRGVYKAD